MTARRAYIFGYPISHSISPPIHNAAFRARGLEVEYQALEVPPAGLASGVQRLRQPDVVGANITVPHKEAVLRLVDEVDEEVAAIGAANTIANLDGRLRASNTDAPGFARALLEAGVAVAGRRVVLLGAGGSARAVTQALLAAGVGRLVVANRHPERAERLVQAFRARFPAAELLARPLHGLDPTEVRRAELLINTTTVGLHDDRSPLEPGLLPSAGMVVDIIYNPPRTRLLREAEGVGLAVMNGLPMLVHQAAVAWETWMSQPAPLEAMWAAARAALQTPA
jgi:shikimate dehydrogenase